MKRVLDALNQVAWYRGKDWYVAYVLVLVPTDRDYKDSDAGDLPSAVRQGWRDHKGDIDVDGHAPIPKAPVRVQGIPADLFVGLQNFAIDHFELEGVDVMVTLAPSAVRYFDEATADSMMEAFARGAKVASVMVPEDGIDELVARGTLGGPITAWDLEALIEAGRFDNRAAQPRILEENPNAGVEEIHPLVRIISYYGPCVAPILPRAIVEKRVLKGEDLDRHLKQIESKTVRQRHHARAMGIEDEKFFEFFASGVMPEYRLKPPQ